MTEPKEEPGKARPEVDTGGGAVVKGSVDTGGGSFIGRDKITIFNVAIPMLLVWLMGAGILVALGVFTWSIFGDNLAARFRELRMNGIFNIAIVEFGEIQPSGEAMRSQDGADMSQWLYDGLMQSYAEFAFDGGQATPTQREVLIWSRTSPEVAGHRGRFGPLLAPDPEMRCAAARQLAQEIGAQLVIYGAIDKRTSPASFLMEFYASEDVVRSLKLNNIQTSAVYTGTASPPVSCLPIGEPIAVASPLVGASEREATFRAIARGSEFFFWLTLGLVREQLGLPQAALENFLALDAHFDANVSRSDARRYGQDLINFFIGQQYIFQLAGQFESANINIAQLDLALLDQAQAHFQEASELRGRHLDRALIGLGNVWTYIGSLAQAARAQTSPPTENTAGEVQEYTTAADLISQATQSQAGAAQLLARAGQYYASAAAEAAATGDAYVLLIAELAQAATAWAQGQDRYLAGDLEAAIPLMEQAIAGIRTGDEPLLSRLEAWGDRRLVAKAQQTLGLSHLQLADIARIQGQPAAQVHHAEEAIAAFERCIDVAAQSGAGQQDAILADEIVADICEPYLQTANDLLEAR